MEKAELFADNRESRIFATGATRADEGAADEMNSFESESQIVLDVQCPSSQFGGGSFIDTTMNLPVLPESTRTDNNKRFDFPPISAAASLTISDEEESKDDGESDTFESVFPCHFELPRLSVD